MHDFPIFPGGCGGRVAVNFTFLIFRKNERAAGLLIVFLKIVHRRGHLGEIK